MKSLMRSIRRSPLAMAFASSSAAIAGPPFLTDDAMPVEPGTLEVILYSEGGHSSEAFEGSSGLDIAYGLVEDVELSLVLPVGYGHDDGWYGGLGDAQMGARYRLLEQKEGGLMPTLSVVSAISLPTGDENVGSGKASVALSVFAQHDFDDWSLFGGGGYATNPGEENLDYWTLGYAVTRQFDERWSAGVNLAFESKTEVDGRDSYRIEVGGSMAINDRWALMAAVNEDLADGFGRGVVGFYVGLQFSN